MEQYNLFGNIEQPYIKEKETRRLKTMQEKFGTIQGETCETCGHLVKHIYDRTYYKCESWRMSNSAATDIRLKNQACGKWVPGE